MRRVRSAEGLDDVVVCAEAECTDFVHVLKACRYHQDWDVEFLAHRAADGKTVSAGQHDVQQDKAVIARERQAFALIAVR